LDERAGFLAHIDRGGLRLVRVSDGPVMSAKPLHMRDVGTGPKRCAARFVKLLPDGATAAEADVDSRTMCSDAMGVTARFSRPDGQRPSHRLTSGCTTCAPDWHVKHRSFDWFLRVEGRSFLPRRSSGFAAAVQGFRGNQRS